jgi:hypothetical protein
VAFHIEYFRAGVKVMAVPCRQSLDVAEQIALEELRYLEATHAQILDMDDGGTVVVSVSCGSTATVFGHPH